MKNNKWGIRITAVTLATVTLCGGIVLAAAGDRDDPLITLSYLTETAIPGFLKDVENNTKKEIKTIEDDVEDLIADYEKEMKKLVDAVEGGSGTVSPSYVLVTLAKGQTLLPSIGSEMLLREGTVTVESTTAPALIDTTTGGDVGSGTSLEKNHLYMASSLDRILTATTEGVKILVRGEHTIR